VEAARGKLKFTHFENDTALDGVSTQGPGVLDLTVI
jgi:hypothetical protein